MCGITAILSKNPDVAKDLIAALKRLEYRGYDSAGICIHNGEKLVTEKRVGKVQGLDEVSASSHVKGNLGIAHTRYMQISICMCDIQTDAC